ncbi:uncharacterized protein LOC141901819 [Tubulanus polymorphus]|uniref:uncharacterized protein LOC141901819 n=1 Tax=Tubulanus polymorphus TaxID=672921 RepID=UPI003DA2214B
MLMLIKYKMSDVGQQWEMVTATELAQIVRTGADEVIIIDSRSFLEYNTCNIQKAVNISCSKLVKRRLEQDKVNVLDLLSQSCSDSNINSSHRVIVYDQCTETPASLNTDCFLSILLKKLQAVFKKVQLLKGGFLEFQANTPMLCESRSETGGSKYGTLSSISQPCLPVSNIGPTKILPFLYLGSQKDSVSQECIKMIGVTYILNVSTKCPKPPFIQEGHFLRIPVNDNYNDKLSTYFNEAFQYIDKVREANGCVLIHCLAGISRSPTLAIAYIMKYLKMSSEEAYRYVKDKRPTISPNFNFLGQLLEYEKALLWERGETPSDKPTFISSSHKASISSCSSSDSPTSDYVECFPWRSWSFLETKTAVQSPTTALAKLNFSQPPPPLPSSGPGVSSGAYDLPNCFPTTSLDKLSFTPCLAGDDSFDRFRTTGTKRPLSFSTFESKSTRLRKDVCDTSSSSSRDADDSKNYSESSVTLRSPEMRAKRPLVRPNTIAFSTYPIFDIECKQPPSAIIVADADTATAPHLEDPTPSTDLQDHLRRVNSSASFSSGYSPNTKQRSAAAIKPIDGARKSRSLDDILVTSSETLSECGGGAVVVAHQQQHQQQQQQQVTDRKLKQCGITSADIFGKNVDLETVHHNRCIGTTDTHQSNSSISSTGSHGSVHGSLEMIPVS